MRYSMFFHLTWGTAILQWNALGLKAGGAFLTYLLGMQFLVFPRLVSKCSFFANSNSRLNIHCKFSWVSSLGNARWQTPPCHPGNRSSEKDCSHHATNIILRISCPATAVQTLACCQRVTLQTGAPNPHSLCFFSILGSLVLSRQAVKNGQQMNPDLDKWNRDGPSPALVQCGSVIFRTKLKPWKGGMLQKGLTIHVIQMRLYRQAFNVQWPSLVSINRT